MRTLVVQRDDGSVGAWIGLGDEEAAQLGWALVEAPSVRRVACVEPERARPIVEELTLDPDIPLRFAVNVNVDWLFESKVVMP